MTKMSKYLFYFFAFSGLVYFFLILESTWFNFIADDLSWKIAWTLITLDALLGIIYLARKELIENEAKRKNKFTN